MKNKKLMSLSLILLTLIMMMKIKAKHIQYTGNGHLIAIMMMI